MLRGGWSNGGGSGGGRSGGGGGLKGAGGGSVSFLEKGGFSGISKGDGEMSVLRMRGSSWGRPLLASLAGHVEKLERGEGLHGVGKVCEGMSLV